MFTFCFIVVLVHDGADGRAVEVAGTTSGEMSRLQAWVFQARRAC